MYPRLINTHYLQSLGISMDYEKFYMNMINTAKLSNRVKRCVGHPQYEYYEEHHIVPRCMGGSDEHENLVLLTAREHFIAHASLVKFVCDPDSLALLKFALFSMCNQRADGQDPRYTPSSKLYAMSKRLHAEAMSDLHSGKVLSAEHIQAFREGHAKFFADPENVKRIGDKARLRWADPDYKSSVVAKLKSLYDDPSHVDKVKNGLLAHYQTEAGANHKALTSSLAKERWNDGAYRENFSQKMREHYASMTDDEYAAMCKMRSDSFTPELRQRISETSKANAKETHKPVECEHCKKMISRQNYSKFHGSKCTALTGVKHTKEKTPCVHCGKLCAPALINRWHNDNCKLKPQA